MARQRLSYPRQQLRRAWWGWLRHNWMFVAALGIVWSVSAFVLSVVMDGYILGLLQAGLLGVFAVLLRELFFAIHGTRFLAGAFGEDNTRDVLRWARKHGVVEGWVDRVATWSGDIDHLVVFRDGHVLAIDSKWHTTALSSAILARDTSSAITSARRAQRVMQSAGHRLEIGSLAVCWGPAQYELIEKGALRAGDTELIAGRRLKAWLREQANGRGSDALAKTRLTAIKGFVARVHPPVPEPSR